MNSAQLPYLPKTLEVLNKIEHFEEHFNDDGCSPEYRLAWEKNKKHGIALPSITSNPRALYSSTIS
jgi:hypothetical protein